MGEIPYGGHAGSLELPLRGVAHVEEIAHGRIPNDVRVVLPRDLRHSVGLHVVAAELSEHLVPGHAH